MLWVLDQELSPRGHANNQLNESGYISEEVYEVNFVKKLQRGSGRFKGKLPFKCLSFVRVGHYTTRCPHNKGNMYEEDNRSYYTHDNSDEDNQEIKLLMAYENKDVEPKEVTRLKEKLESVTRVREQLQDIVKDQSITIQRLESKILSLKEDLKESKRRMKKLLKNKNMKWSN